MILKIICDIILFSITLLLLFVDNEIVIQLTFSYLFIRISVFMPNNARNLNFFYSESSKIKFDGCFDCEIIPMVSFSWRVIMIPVSPNEYTCFVSGLVEKNTEYLNIFTYLSALFQIRNVTIRCKIERKKKVTIHQSCTSHVPSNIQH